MVNVSVDRLVESCEKAQEEKFTGCVLAYSYENVQWKIYFFMGRLIWGAGGNHRFRRWFRLIAKHFPNIDSNALPEPDVTAIYLWEYVVLSKLLRDKKVESTAVSKFIDEALIEILFEILQEAIDFKHSEEDSFYIKKLTGVMTMKNPLKALDVAHNTWKRWFDSGLIEYSPNLAPDLRNPKALKEKVPEASYAKLAKLLKGNRSLREISAFLKVESLTLTQSLFPFIDQGIIRLRPIPDWMPPGSTAVLKSTKVPQNSEVLQKNPDQPLIVCIDDSPSICHALGKVIQLGGYRFIGLQDSLQALPILLEKKPDLIFLDLVMPVASGYEICAQIRRVETLKSTPVIILTGKDGMVDRVRAKLVGASDFLTKPVQPQKVLDITNRYLGLNISQSQVNARLDQENPLINSEAPLNYGNLPPQYG